MRSRVSLSGITRAHSSQRFLIPLWLCLPRPSPHLFGVCAYPSSSVLTFPQPTISTSLSLPFPSLPSSLISSFRFASRDFFGLVRLPPKSDRLFAVKIGSKSPNAEKKKTKKVHRIAEVSPLFPTRAFFLHSLPPQPSHRLLQSAISDMQRYLFLFASSPRPHAKRH